MSETNYNPKILGVLADLEKAYNEAPKKTHQEMTDAILRAINFGKQVERERIIKLLQELRGKARQTKGLTTNINVNAVIALIRGEIK